MARFVLTAQLKLAAPTNVKSVVSSIQKQLNGVKVNVQVSTTVQAVKQINNLTNATKAAGTAAESMGNAFGVSLKRFAAFSIASRAIGLVATKLSGAVDEAIAFQNEMVRLSQVTGKTLIQLKSVSDQVGRLASTFGVSSKEILGVTSTLAQAGIEAQDLTTAINALAKTALAPSFGKIQDTAEGAIAVIAQFGEGVGALERQLGSINRVAAKFAVESQDLITVIRTTGGVFKASGGDLEDLLGLFTSVRSTTRESAESIATGLRTIFTRIQRPETIRYLQQFGVELTNVEGKFVGPFEAIKQLSAALSGLGEGDIRFIKVAEELGGFRQIGKVIPLLRQFEIAEKARQVAIEGGNSLDEDVATAQQSLQVQFTKTREAFLKLIRDVSDTSTFKVMISTSLQLANTLIKVADAIKPLIPLITTLATIKFAQGIGSFFAGVGAGFKKVVGPTGKNKGGKIHAFARGGLVPGTGNRDTVPAVLSPGEFVIRKSSVESIGAENLANINKYATGGLVQTLASRTKDVSKSNKGSVGAAVLEYKKDNLKYDSFELKEKDLAATGRKLTPEGKKYIAGFVKAPVEGLNEKSYNVFNEAINRGLVLNANLSARNVARSLGIGFDKIPKSSESKFLNSVNDGARGNLFEDILSVLSQGSNPFAENSQRPFDFPSGLASVFKDDFTNLPSSWVDAKASFKQASGSLKRKTISQIVSEVSQGGLDIDKYFQNPTEPVKGNEPSGGATRAPIKRAIGGSVTDTVPALLTPGEFVVNKQSAQSIGYSALNSMNKKGVQGFAKGGRVHRFAKGGKTPAGGGGIGDFGLVVLPTLISNLAGATSDAESAFSRVVASATSLVSTFGILQLVAGKLGIALNLKSFTSGKDGIGQAIASKLTPGKGRGFNENFNFTASGNKPITIKDIKAARVDAGKPAKTERATARIAAQEAVNKLKTIPQNAVGSDASLREVYKADAIDKVKEFNARNSKIKSAESILGNRNLVKGTGGIAQKLGSVASRGGFVGGAARLAGGAIGFGGGAAAGIGGVLAGIAGPAVAVIAGFTAISSVIDAFNGYSQKANKAIADGNVARAKEYAVMAAVPGIFSGFTDTYLSFAEAFGGDSKALIEANAASQALAAKYNKEYAANAKASSDALADVAAGTRTLSEAFASGDLTKNLKNALDSQKAEQKRAKALEASKSGGLTGNVRDVLSITGLVDSSAARNEKISKDIEDGKKRAQETTLKEFDSVKESTRPLNAALFAAGKGVDEVIKSFRDSNTTANEVIGQFEVDAKSGDTQLARLRQEFINQQKVIQDNIKFLQAANLGLREVSANSSAAALALENIGEGNKNRSSTGTSILEASISDIASALNPQDVEIAQKEFAQALSKFGASDAQIKKTIGNFKLINDAQKGVPEAFKRTLAGFDAGTFGVADVVPRFKAEVAKLAGGTEEGVKQLTDLFANVDIKDEDLIALLKTQDVSGAAKALLEKAVEPLKDSLSSNKDNAKITEKLNSLNKEKIDLEKQYVDSRKASIAIELEARQALEEFGGPLVTAADRLRTLNEQINSDLSLGGGQQIGKGSAGDILRVQQSLEREITALGVQKTSNLGSAFGGATEESANREATLRDNAKALLDYNRQRLALVREEISIAEKKNALEKSAFEKLLGGDIQGAIEDQAASAAAEALKSGNSGLAKLFGPQALIGGLKSLEGQGLTKGEQLRAAQTAGSTVGASDRLARAFSGTTPQQQALQQEGRGLASSLNLVGQGLARLDQQSVDSKNAQINAANRISSGPGGSVQNGLISSGGVVARSAAPAAAQTAAEIAKQSTQSSAVAQGAARAGGVSNSAGISLDVMNSFNSAVNTFSAAVNKLESLKISVKIDPVNVSLNAGFLSNISNEARNGVIDAVAVEIKKYKVGENGELMKTGSVLG